MKLKVEDIERLVREAIEKLEKVKIDENYEFRRKVALDKLYDALRLHKSKVKGEVRM